MGIPKPIGYKCVLVRYGVNRSVDNDNCLRKGLGCINPPQLSIIVGSVSGRTLAVLPWRDAG